MKEVLKSLREGNIILYPTDTVWGIGCDATNVNAIKKIYELKRREESKSLIILVSSIQMLEEYVERIPNIAIEILNKVTTPTTIIYPNPKGLANNVIADDNTIAIRVVKNDFCEKLINKLGKPIVSTSANISGNPTPKSFFEIENAIINNVDYIVKKEPNKTVEKVSTILKIEENTVITIRE